MHNQYIDIHFVEGEIVNHIICQFIKAWGCIQLWLPAPAATRDFADKESFVTWLCEIQLNQKDPADAYMQCLLIHIFIDNKMSMQKFQV